ncbi:unnamed protein product [Rhizoctonia solani]|uniref:CHAT domain-containing protein n=1 Tax=Rhizoctonia solani TaxID=456999 RepID=A0A8H3CX20_9AGAM|nr:unnamed protein product [Rhizoctonia solani]
MQGDFDEQRELEKVNNNIGTLTRELFGSFHDLPSAQSLLTRLGRYYHNRYDLLYEPDDLDKAVDYLSNARTLTLDGDPTLAKVLYYLAGAHGARSASLSLGRLSDVEKAIGCAEIAAELIPDGDPDLSTLFFNLADDYNSRFDYLGQVSDLGKIIMCRSRTLALTPEGDSELPSALYDLAHAFLVRFDRTSQPNDLDEAIKHLSRAVTLNLDSRPNLKLPILDKLGACFRSRFVSLGQMNDIEQAVELQSRALASTPDDHARMMVFLDSSGLYHKERFERDGELEDLEKSIEYESRELSITQEGDPRLWYTLYNLGGSHIHRYERLRESVDLEKVIEYRFRALVLTPVGHPKLPDILSCLGMYHNHRFDCLGEPSDLEKAIAYGNRALSLTSGGDSMLPELLGTLGMSYHLRFRRFGDLVDLDKSIEHQSRATTLAPHGTNTPMILSNLGGSHLARFDRLGELKDIDKAIEYGNRALTLTPDDHPDSITSLSVLAGSYMHRFQRLKDVGDITESIELQMRALSLCSDDNSHLADVLNNLGTTWCMLFERTSDPDLLEKGIEHQSRALSLTPDDHPSLATRLYHLGGCHSLRYGHFKMQQDAEIAIEYCSRALALTPNGHPWQLNIMGGLAQSLLQLYNHTGDQAHIQRSQDSYRSASQSSTTSPRLRFRIAKDWARLTSKYYPQNCIEAYQTIIDLLPQFIWLGAATDQRYEDLSMTEMLAENAASAAIRSTQYELALEWLEHARCVVWNQTLMLRSPLDQLQSVDPQLGHRLQSLAKQLHDAGSKSREAQTPFSVSMTPEEVAQQHRLLAKEYDELLAQARHLPGFEDFLRPMKAQDLFRAARNGPVVVINCHTDCCDALVIQQEQAKVSRIPLTAFSESKAKEFRRKMTASLRRKGVRERGFKMQQEPGYKDGMPIVLASLWYDIVKPILEFMGYMSNNASEGLPHITWCPTGTLSFLPLHAAGDYDVPRSRVFDYVISSYTPTLTALLTSTPRPLNSNCRVLAIGQAATPGRSPLPGTTKELEFLEAHAQHDTQFSQLMDHQATVTAVLDAMEQHDWVHLACHAHQNLKDPTKSGFFLHDGTLDIATINRRSFKNKGLAFLSACQTATGDENLPDEAVHLASGMLMAGYASVIATMWSVHDEDAPLVADKVYAQLMKEGGIRNGEAGKALHTAVAVLRETVGERKFERWVPYIHIGS